MLNLYIVIVAFIIWSLYMVNKTPLVSICVACYKSTNFIHRTVDSILVQTYKNWELILVDDCSPDNTFDVLSDIAKSDSRIHAFRSDKNNGKAAPTFNMAVKKSHGDFIQILGHDDTLSPDALEKCIARHIETGADIILPDAVFFFEDEPEKNWTMAGIVEHFGQNNKHIDRSVTLTGRDAVIKSLNWSIHGWAMIKSELLRRHPFCEIGMNGDEFSIRECFLDANMVAFCDGKYYYYQEKDSITKKLSPKIFDVWDASNRLEKLLIDNNFPKKVIRDYNRSRFNNYNYLIEKFELNRDKMSQQDIELSIKNLDSYRKSLKFYKTFFDYIFRKEKIGFKRTIVLFNTIKITYTKKH